MEHRFEETHLDHAIDRAFLCLAAQASEFRRKAKKSQDRHVGVGRRILRQVADQAFGGKRIVEHVKSAHENLALRRRDESRDHAHGGGFARAVRPEEAEHLAHFHLERHAVHGRLGAKGFPEISNFNHCAKSRLRCV